MERLQNFIREYGKSVINQLQVMPDGLAHMEPWITNRRESYASAEAAFIMSYLYRKEGDLIYLENFLGLLKRSISLLKKKKANNSSFTKVFIFHYSILSILILPDEERKIYIDLMKNEFTAFRDECYAINVNCAALQYGNEIFLMCMNSKRENVLFLEHLLNHIEKSQNKWGFINDSCAEGELPIDGMPIAYHMFCCYLLVEVLLVDKSYQVLCSAHREKIENIITAGIKWLSYAAYDVGDVAMAERSRYQVFTMGIQATLVAVYAPEQVEKVLKQLLNQYGFNKNEFCCTPNSFSASVRVGYESYTRTNDYNNLNIAGFIIADLCLDTDILKYRGHGKRNRGLFVDADSGYAFYRNEHGFMGIALRNHKGRYLAQGSGFHYRLNNCLLPLADSCDNVANKITEGIKIREIGGGGYFSLWQ